MVRRVRLRIVIVFSNGTKCKRDSNSNSVSNVIKETVINYGNVVKVTLWEKELK